MNERPRVAVVDHGAGNLVSISQALERVGAEAVLAADPGALAGVDGVVLPGVGSTGAVMSGIAAGGFTEPLTQVSVPLLGICVGMQVLFDGSDEDDAACLGLIPGRVRRLEEAPTLPHIGWNDLEPTGVSDLYAGIEEPVVYFVHSYAPVPEDTATVTATTVHGERFVAGVRAGSVEGVQFHPERSGVAGLRILSRYVERCRSRRHAA